MKTIAYLGNFGPSFSTESHLRRTLINMGHRVVSLQENKVNLDTVVYNKCI